MDVIWFLIIGAVAGWLAGKFTKGSGFGLVGNLVVGIIGAIVGGFAFKLLGLTAGGLIGNLVVATIGALLFFYLVGLFVAKKA